MSTEVMLDLHSSQASVLKCLAYGRLRVGRYRFEATVAPFRFPEVLLIFSRHQSVSLAHQGKNECKENKELIESDRCCTPSHFPPHALSCRNYILKTNKIKMGGGNANQTRKS